MLRKRIKKNTLKWKKIYAEQFLDMMDEEENALQKIYLTGYVLELKKNRYFAGWYKDRIVCRSLEYARYFPSAEAAEEYVHKYLGFAGMTCYICHVNWTLASCGSENMEDNEENLLEENGKILSFAKLCRCKAISETARHGTFYNGDHLCKPEKEDYPGSIRTILGDWRTVPFLYGKTGGNWMEWKIYEEWLDITLYRQMTNLIYKLSSKEFE